MTGDTGIQEQLNGETTSESDGQRSRDYQR